MTQVVRCSSANRRSRSCSILLLGNAITGKAKAGAHKARVTDCVFDDLDVSCHRYVTADAMGMAKERGRREEEDVDGAGIGLSTSTVKDTTMYPGSGSPER